MFKPKNSGGNVTVSRLAGAGLLALTLAAPAPVIAQNESALRDDYVAPVKQSCPKNNEKELALVQAEQAVSGMHQSWKTPGSQKYLVAKQIFDTLTQVYGTSGAFAAGVVGNLANESNFIEDRAESKSQFNSLVPASQAVPSAGNGGKFNLRFGMNNKKPIIGMAIYPKHADPSGGGGLFQFTPYTEFTNSPYWGKLVPDGWAAANQIAFVMEDHFGKWNGNGPYYETDVVIRYLKERRPHSVQENISMMNPRDAATAFWTGYLRPKEEAGHNNYKFPREADAEIANAMFNSANIPADPSKWGWIKPKRGSDGGSGEVGELELESAFKDECGNPAKPVGLDISDYTGSHGITGIGVKGRGFAVDDLPDNLRKYAIDPTVFGLKQRSCNAQWTSKSDYGAGSTGLNNQCVALSKVLFKSIWWDEPAASNLKRLFSGNGGVIVTGPSGAANRIPPRKVLDTPTFGAVVQAMPPGSRFGHTFVVSHVFENGDILVVEQNSGSSGASAGTVCDWNYRIYTKDGLVAIKAKFFAPDRSQFRPSSKLAAITGGESSKLVENTGAAGGSAAAGGAAAGGAAAAN